MLGGLVTPADYNNASLGMGLSITSKLEGECLGGCGVGSYSYTIEGLNSHICSLTDRNLLANNQVVD